MRFEYGTPAGILHSATELVGLRQRIGFNFGQNQEPCVYEWNQ